MTTAVEVGYGCMPERTERIDDVHEWVAALNAWKGAQIAAWLARPQWSDPALSPQQVAPGAGYDARGGQALIDYAVPSGRPSVILGRHLATPTHMPMPLPHDVVERLVGQGVVRLVVGHTPHGNCPTIIKQPEATRGHVTFQTVMADTSFSDSTVLDNRGIAVSTIDLYANGDVVVCGVLPEIAGVLPPAASIAYVLHPPTLYEPPPYAIDLVGRHEAARAGVAQRYVKARLSSGQLLMCRNEGYKMEYSTVPWQEGFRLVLPERDDAHEGMLAMADGSSRDASAEVTAAPEGMTPGGTPQ